MSAIRQIRNAARALIIKDGKLLAVKMQDNKGIFYVLPGGGQKPGETLSGTLKRECLEETGYTIKVGELCYLREYIGKNHNFNIKHRSFHQVETVFICEIDENKDKAHSHETDRLQIGVEWIDLNDLKEKKIYPKIIKELIKDGKVQANKRYLGDIC